MIRTRALLVVAALVVMTGCGGSSSDTPKAKDLSSLSATAILAKAKAQVVKESNVSIASTEGSAQFIKFDYAGDDSYGSIGTDNGVLTVFNIGGVTYYKPDDAFWKATAGDQAATIIAKVNGRWIKPAADSSFNDFLQVAQKSALSTQILAPQGTVSKAGTKTVNGVTCIVLKDGAVGSLYVSVKNGRPIQLTSKASGILNFSFEKVDLPDPPGAAETVDESGLGMSG